MAKVYFRTGSKIELSALTQSQTGTFYITNDSGTKVLMAGQDGSAPQGISVLHATNSDLATRATNADTAVEATKVPNFAGVMTEFKTALLEMVYPVGAIYMSTVNESPATFLGGTWATWGAGRVPVGVAASGTFATAGATGGTETTTLTVANLPSHNHTGSSNSTGAHTHTAQSAGAHSHSAGSADAGSHYHEYNDVKLNNTDITLGSVTVRIHPFGQGNGVTDTTDYAGIHSHTISVYEGGAHTHTTDSQGSHSHTITIGNTGSGTSFNNLQPYVVCYMWKRTA